MKKPFSLVLLLMMILSIMTNSVSSQSVNKETYTVIYDEAHDQYFTHDMMNSALSSLNSSFDRDNLDITIKLINLKEKFTTTNLQGADLLIISNPGKGVKVDSGGEEVKATSALKEHGGSILYLSNPFSFDMNISGHAEGMDPFLQEVLQIQIRKPVQATDNDNTTILINDFSNDGNNSHIYLSYKNIKPQVLMSEINNITNSKILYYGSTIDDTGNPSSLFDVVGNTSLATYSVSQNYEKIDAEFFPNDPPKWMIGDSFTENEGRALVIGSTIMFSDLSYDDTSNWIDQMGNLEFFQNIIAWLLKITPLEKIIPTVTEDVSYFLRINLLSGALLSGALLLIVLGSFVYSGKISLTGIFGVRIKKSKKIGKSTSLDHKTDQVEKPRKKKSRQRRKRI